MSKKIITYGFVISGLFITTSMLFGWPWNFDMYYQPAVKAWELLFTPPAESIPVSGKIRTVSKDDSELKLKNPIPLQRESIEKGRILYDAFCTPCHGARAKGDGPVAEKFVPPPDLTIEDYLKRKDGFFFAIIKEGGAIMPSYGERLNTEEMWGIVNYLRELQKNETTK